MKSKLFIFFIFFIFVSCDRERKIDWERRGGRELAKGQHPEKPSSATDNEPLELRYVNLDYISPSILEGMVELEIQKDYYQHDTEEYGFVTNIFLNFQLHKNTFIVDLQENKDIGTWECKQTSRMLVHPFECKSLSIFFNLKKIDKKIKFDQDVKVSVKFQEVFEGEIHHPELSDKVPLKGYKYQVQQGKTTSVYIKVSPVGVDASAPLKYFYTSYYTESKDSSSINYSFILMLPRIIKDKPLMTFLTISKKAFENEMFYSQKEYELNLPFREEDYTSEPQSLGVKLWRK